MDRAQRLALQRRRVRDLDGSRAEATLQKSSDLAGAKRRPLQPPMRQSACQYGRNSHHSGRSMGGPEQAPVGRQD